MNPIIGIIVCGISEERQFVSSPYITSIEKAGGLPLMIPYCMNANLFRQYLNICDGFLFCGGDDISPLLFGEELLTSCGKTDWKIDLFHIDFMKAVLSAHLPVLGICRGMQVINVALGGSLYQDISLRPEPSFHHMQLSKDRSDPCHKITISKNSILYNICGVSFVCNSFHHQCIKELGEQLKVTAITSDGVIEAIESHSYPFLLGVQWHPECMYDTHESMRQLFTDFITKSKDAKKIMVL